MTYASDFIIQKSSSLRTEIKKELKYLYDSLGDLLEMNEKIKELDSISKKLDEGFFDPQFFILATQFFEFHVKQIEHLHSALNEYKEIIA